MATIFYGEGEDLPRDRRPLAGLGRTSQGQRVTARERLNLGRDLPALLPGAATRPYPVYTDPGPNEPDRPTPGG